MVVTPASPAVYVRGFDFGTTEEQIKKHMSGAGPVKSVEMWGRGAAVAVYATPAQAQAAVKKFNQSTIPGNSRFIDVKLDANEGEPGKRGRMGAGRVFVRGFDFGVTDEQLEAHMSSVGPVINMQWCTKGSAIVHYGTRQEAEAAAAALNQTTLEGNSRYIDVIVKEDEDGAPPAKKYKKGGGKGNGNGSWVQMPWNMMPMVPMQMPMMAIGNGMGYGGGGKGGGGKGKGKADPAGSGRVFVRGFDFGTDDDSLIAHMSAAGAIHDVKWATKGSAEIVYKRKASATKAVNTLHQTIIPGNSRYIDVMPKE